MGAARKFTSDHTRAEGWRTKIKASQLLNRLQANALGELKKELTQGEIASIKILLAKVMPDLASVEVKGNVAVNHIVRLPAPVASIDDWSRSYADPLRLNAPPIIEAAPSKASN